MRLATFAWLSLSRPPRRQPPTPAGADSRVTIVVAVGMIAATVVYLPAPRLGAEAFMLPKELVASITATVAAIAMLISRPVERISARALWILATCSLTAVSMIAAQNRWLALRAGTQLLGSFAIFWVAANAGEHQRRMLLRVGIAAGVLVAVSMLLEAYDIVQLAPTVSGRSPGGLLGNRNLASRFIAIALCLALFGSMSALTLPRQVLLAASIGLMTWALALARTRAAWVGVLSGIVVFLSAALVVVGWARFRLVYHRLALPAAAAMCAIFLAVMLPNPLKWSSSHPFRDTITRLAEFQKGSGAGRIRQYRQTLRMIRSRPLKGVGLGNWSVEYPRFLRIDEDEYYSYRGGPRDRMATSDLMTLMAEGGFVLLLFGSGVLCFGLGAIPFRKDVDCAQQFRWSAYLAMAVALGVMMIVDNIILVQPTAYLSAVVLACLSARPKRLILLPRSRWVRQGGSALAMCVGIVAIGRLTIQNTVASIFATGVSTWKLQSLSELDPGEYWLYSTLSFEWRDRGRCDLARVNAIKAGELYPSALEPRIIQAVCAEKTLQREGTSWRPLSPAN